MSNYFEQNISTDQFWPAFISPGLFLPGLFLPGPQIQIFKNQFGLQGPGKYGPVRYLLMKMSYYHSQKRIIKSQKRVTQRKNLLCNALSSYNTMLSNIK